MLDLIPISKPEAERFYPRGADCAHDHRPQNFAQSYVIWSETQNTLVCQWCSEALQFHEIIFIRA